MTWMWNVDAPGWRAAGGDELDDDVVLDTLALVPDHYAGAVESLADTPVPCAAGGDGEADRG